MTALLLCIAAYLLGSIPFGLILTKLVLKQDVRDIGSGNTGATNVMRTGSKKLAALTLLFDAVKGAIIICAFGLFETPQLALIVGLFAILGHCFPVWLKFKGGKGVATTLGVLLAAVPVTGLIACAVWILSFLAARISSLAALTAMLVAPAVTYGIYGLYPALINLIITALVFARHHENIARLAKGKEAQFRK